MTYPPLNQEIVIRPVEQESDLHRSFTVMTELRPHLTDSSLFVQQIHRQQQQGYTLIASWRGSEIVGLAGYRLQENLYYGRFLYIDDLVTTEAVRHLGIGSLLLQAVTEIARQQQCTHLALDTGLVNALAQRFYFRQGLLAKALHFNLSLI